MHSPTLEMYSVPSCLKQASLAWNVLVTVLVALVVNVAECVVVGVVDPVEGRVVAVVVAELVTVV